MWNYAGLKKMMDIVDGEQGKNETTQSSMQHKRLLKNPCVRRQLFPAEADESMQSTECLAKPLDEYKLEQKKMIKKYNFDFKNEFALIGKYEWFHKEGDDWMKMQATNYTAVEDDVPENKENVWTPKIGTAAELEGVRKRKREVRPTSEKGAKRMISFE